MAPEHVRELFARFGTVVVKRMFGGAGIYAQETMFALLHDGVIYLKTDPHNAAAFAREDLAPFTYTTRNGKRAVIVLPAHAGPPLRRSRRARGLGRRGAGGGAPRRHAKAAPAGRTRKRKP